jgi:hypothetical protein
MRMSLKELEEAARVMTREALRKHPPFPPEIDARLTLGEGIEGAYRVFELYVSGERPEDATVLTRARIHASTGEGEVEVFPERWCTTK